MNYPQRFLSPDVSMHLHSTLVYRCPTLATAVLLKWDSDLLLKWDSLLQPIAAELSIRFDSPVEYKPI